MVGLPVFLGTDRTNAQAFVQIPGPAKRMRADDFLEAVGKLPTLGDVLHRYTQALFTMVAQTSACNRLHMMTERCARWLLHTHDRVGGGPFPLTHQFLSQMLGVRRASVSEAMHALQNYGVSYSNGLVTIEDRDALESAACECYAVVINEFNRLLRDRANRPENAPKDPLDGVPTSENGHTVLDAPLPETADD
jgi:hypothetical protein